MERRMTEDELKARKVHAVNCMENALALLEDARQELAEVIRQEEEMKKEAGK